MSAIKVTIQSAGGTKFTVNVSIDMTVVEFKAQISEEANCPPEHQRLIHRGRVLRDEVTLESYGIMDSHTVHLVRSSRTQNPSDTPQTHSPSFQSMGSGANPLPSMPGSGMNSGAANPYAVMMNMQQGPPDINRMQQQLLQNPEMMQSIMNSPMMQNLMDNPDVIRNMLQNNPQMQAVLQENPQLTHVLNDPSLMRQTMDMIRNPAAMREMMRTQDLAISQLENHPEGFNALRRMYTDVQEPMMQASIDAASSSSSASSTQTGTASTTVDTNGALPNPWASAAPQSSPSNPAGGIPGGASPMGLPPGLMSMIGGAPNSAMPGAMPGGAMPDMNTYMQMMQDPMAQQMMSQMLSDPNMMEQMMNNNPMMRQMVDSNPQVGQMLRNPEFLRQLSDPNTIQSMLQMEQAMQQMQPGVNPMAAMMQHMQRQQPASGSNLPGVNPMAAMMQHMQRQQPTARANPWANTQTTFPTVSPSPVPPTTSTSTAVSSLDFSALLTQMGAATVREDNNQSASSTTAGVSVPPQTAVSASTATTTATATSPSESAPTTVPQSDAERYATQLQQLAGMGFTDTDASLQALVQTRGNVNAAVEKLLGAS